MQFALILARLLVFVATADLRRLLVGVLGHRSLLRGLFDCFDAAALLAQKEFLLVLLVQFHREALVVEVADVHAGTGSGLLRRLQLRELGALVVTGARLISLATLAAAYLLVDVEVLEEVGAMVVVVDRRIVIRYALVVLLVILSLPAPFRLL